MIKHPLLFVLILAGCSSVSSAGHSTSRPTSQPSTRQMSIAHADASSIDTLFATANIDGQSVELTLTDKIPTGGKSTIYFGQMDVVDEGKDSEGKQVTSTSPVIVWRDRGGDRGRILDDPRLHDAAWSYVAAGPAAREIWGVVDASLDEPQENMLLVHSLDGGATFLVTALLKTNQHATFDSFCMSADGHGRVTTYLSAAKGGRHSRQAGYDTFSTADGGRTWKSATHELDAMQSAESVDPDSDEQIEPPAPMQKASFELPKLNSGHL